jgi:hypothetical protein
MQRIRDESGFGCPMLTSYAVAGVGLKADGVLSVQDRSRSLTPAGLLRLMMVCSSPLISVVAMDDGGPKALHVLRRGSRA